jgi:PhzF family phenazine biosynthesis protein
MARRFTQVDAFSAEPFGGNPAAVLVMPAAADSGWMQRVAREMNLSETAFLHPHGVAFDLRWFTPQAEVDLCGHATLASAHVLWSEGHLPAGRAAVFHTRSGELTCERENDGWIRMDFPARPQEPADPPPGLISALGSSPLYTGRNAYDFLVEVGSEEELRALRPDMHALARVPCRGVMVTAAGSAPYDFVSRFFAPAVGVPEDPVTGSSHVCLGPFWAARLGRDELLAYQASARGGVVRVAVRGERVLIGGQAVTVLQGDLLV